MTALDEVLTAAFARGVPLELSSPRVAGVASARVGSAVAFAATPARALQTLAVMLRARPPVSFDA